MSLSSDLWKLREKRLLEEKLKEQKSEEIAPVKTVTEEKAQDDSWVKSSEIWDNGYQFGDVFKTAYQSSRDLSQNILGGILDIGEAVVDTGAYLGGLFSYYNPFNRMLNPDIAEEDKKKTEEFINSDLYDGTEVIKSISNEDLVKQIIGVGTEEGSVFGEKSDSLAQSGGQLAGQLAANAVLPGSGMVLMATTAFGSEVENALNQGATFEEAGLSAAISAGAEVLTEKIGGISFGGKTLTDAAFSKLSKNMTNKVAKVLITSGKVTADALAEGGEEILSGYMGAIGQKLTYMEDKEIEELFSNEDLLESFIGGTVLGGLGGGGSAVMSISKGVDPVSGLTKNERKVVEKVYKDALAEKDGKVSNSEKSKLWNEVVEKMGRGEISTDIIEEVLGDKTYKDYKNTIETEESVMKELEELYEGDELQQQIDDILNNSNRFQIKNQLSNEVSELVKNDRLRESYNEKANRSRQFKADVTKYDPKHRDTIQKAIDSGILNNTRKTHEFVDIIAKISADKGVSFDFLNNQKLKESGFAVDGKQVNGIVTESGISINIDSPKAWQTTVGHEITHVLEGTDMYDALQQTLFDYAKSRKGTDSKFDNEYKERLYNTRQLYKDVKGYEGVDGFTKIKNEVTADLVGDYLFTDEKFIKHLSTKNRNVFEKIYDEIKYLCKVATAGSKEARELEKVKKAFEDAYRASGKAHGETKYSISETTDGRFVAVVDNDILSKVDTSTWDKATKKEVKKAASEELKKFSDGFTINGIEFIGNSDSRREYTRSDYSEALARKNPTAYLDKMRAAAVLDDVIQVATEWKNDGELKYEREDYVDFVRGKTLIMSGDRAYRAIVLAGITSDGRAIFHDVEDIYPDSFELKKSESSTAVSANESPNDILEDSDGVTLAQKDSGVKGKFSLSKSVEETKDLVALHNLTEDKLIKSLELGGLPMPSLAITKSDIPHSNFGEITLVFSRDTIDPKKNKKNKVYSADAWTPVFPRVEYEADSKVASDISQKLRELGKKVDDSFQRDLYRVTYDFDDMLNRNGGEEGLIQRVMDNDGLKAAYLEEQGKHIDKVTKQEEAKKDYNPANADKYQKIMDILGVTTADEMGKVNFKDAKENHGAELEAVYPGITQTAMRMGRLFGAVQSYIEQKDMGTVYNTVTDFDATKKALNDALDAEGYEYWVRNLFSGIVKDSGIYNNKNIFTPSGNRRSFKQTHLPVTLENIVKAMASQNDGNAKNVSGFNGVKTLRAATAETFKSVEEMHQKKGRLQNLTQEQSEAITNDLQTRLYKVIEAIDNESGQIGGSNPYIRMDSIGETLTEIGEGGKYGVADIQSVFSGYNRNISDDTALEVKQLLYDVAQMPVNIFEAKPQRVVNFDEAKVFVIPNNANTKLKQELLNRGYSIAEYDPNVEGDRQKVVNQFEEYKFSLSNIGEQAKYGKYSTPANELRYEAPVQEKLSPTNTTPNTNVSKMESVAPVVGEENANVTPEEMQDLFPDDLAPMDESTENERLASFTDADAPVDVASDDFDSRVDGIVKSLTKLKRNRRILVDGYSVGVYTRNGSDDVTISIKKPDGKIIGGSLTDGKYWTNTQLAREIAEQIAEAEGYVANNEDIAPVKETYEAIKPKREPSNEPIMVTADTVGQRTTRKELQQRIVDGIKSRFAENGIDFDEVLKKAKNLSTFSTVDNTPQRVMEKSLGYKEGQILSDLTVNKVAQNETEGIKWLNSFTDRKNGLLAQISKQYNIKPGSKESSAAQMYAEGFYVDEKNNIVQYGDAELAKDFPDAKVQQNIKGLANDPRIRQIYDDTLAMINESRARNGYPEIPRLDNYFLHFRAMEDTFSRLGLPFNPNDIRAKDLPTDLNGVTADLKPGQPYFASAMHRTGKRTSFDLLGGLEKYLSSAKNQIYHIDDIQTLRALRNYVADTYGQANGLEGLDSLSEEEAQERIEKVYNSHLSTFAKFLNEEANILAGKTALIDRGLEGIIGRRGITFLDTLNKQVGSNMVGYNISSSLTNFIPVAQTFAKTNKVDFVKAFGQTVANKVGSIFGRNDSFTENSPVVIRRKGADRFYRTPFQKAGDAGYVFMSAVDDISTELIARTKYNELTRKGMDSQQAHYETDKWVSRLMGDRSLGQQPQLYNSKMLGLFTKFQLEVRNQLDSQFYDTIQETKASNEEIQNGLARNAKTAAKIASTFVQLAVVQHLFGKAFESVAGYNPAFDIIETLIKTFGWDDDEESEDTVLDNIEQGFFGLLEDLPYTSIFTGGRIPIESALPIEQLVTGKDKYGNEKSRWETLGEVAPYYLLPGGYGQIKKTYQGLDMFSEDYPIAGSYTDIGNLRFPVEDTWQNRLQAGIFGQYASSNARDYFDNDIAPLKENQIQEFADVGMTIQDYWDYREGLSGLNTLAEKADYINSLDLTTEQKNILINNIADRKEKIDMSTYGDYDSFDEFDFATKNPAKYVIAKSVGGYENFKTYSNKLNDIKSDKYGDGKSISGSRKEKVINYVNGLDIDYGQKIILFKSEYKSDNTYNYDIVDYLNSRNDISYDEMVTILKELGFQVSSDGYVTW